ncbi:MAG: insulinase family protein [Muribaculaceae bacterium]|nr:insulinase family protein [Muribaculaceae bacterium]
MKLPKPQLITLSNGLQLVCVHQRGAGAGIFGLTVGAGSSDEAPGEYGLAHLVEHTIFKGTIHRRPWHIINRMEAVGGELNAFTTKEETTLYTIFPQGSAARAIELVADLAINSQFPGHEVDKEREVVIDEINSYRDTPSEAVYDDFEDLVYAGTPLGHNILGSAASVASLDGSDCRVFLDRYYTVGNAVAFYSGPQAPDHIAALVDKYFSALPAGAPRAAREPIAMKAVTDNIVIDGLHQSHTVLGIEVGSMYGSDRYADGLFSNMMGGPGMNSLLNIELRERRGLVYTVESSITRFATTGLMTVYFGCDADDTDRCLDLCVRTANRLADTPASTLDRRIAAAKRQWLGQLAIGSENRENRIMGSARSVLYTGGLTSDEEVVEQIMAVGREQIVSRARSFSEPSVLTFRP